LARGFLRIVPETSVKVGEAYQMVGEGYQSLVAVLA